MRTFKISSKDPKVNKLKQNSKVKIPPKSSQQQIYQIQTQDCIKRWDETTSWKWGQNIWSSPYWLATETQTLPSKYTTNNSSFQIIPALEKHKLKLHQTVSISQTLALNPRYVSAHSRGYFGITFVQKEVRRHHPSLYRVINDTHSAGHWDKNQDVNVKQQKKKVQVHVWVSVAPNEKFWSVKVRFPLKTKIYK